MPDQSLITTADLCALTKSYPQKLQYLAVRFPNEFPMPVRLGGRNFYRPSDAKRVMALAARLRGKKVSL